MPEVDCAITTFCSKQPVLDAEHNIRGYAFCFQRDSGEQDAAVAEANEEALKATADSLQGAMGSDKNPIKVGIDFSIQAIIDGKPYALAPEHAVIELEETECFPEELLDSLQHLRRKKYSVALNVAASSTPSQELARTVDIFKVDMQRTPGTQLAALLQLGHESNCKVLAKKLHTHEAFCDAQKAGFNLFQGYFFQKNATPPSSARALTSLQSTRLRLFRILQSPEPDFGALGEVIQADVSLSYRLLSLLNSPAFKLVRRIDSVGQALVLLGWQRLKSWLLVVILSDLMMPNKCPELVVNSAQRAKFFELAARKIESPFAPETLFLLGLFSLLESLMDVPMECLAYNLPLKNDIKDALCGKQTACSIWLDLAAGFEAQDWDRVRVLLPALGLDPLDSANAYHAANLWANTMLSLF